MMTMKRRSLIILIAAWASLLACGTNSPPSVIKPDDKTASINVDPPNKVNHSDKKEDGDVSNVKEAFQKTGHEMDKGFQKTGHEIKKAFVGDDK